MQAASQSRASGIVRFRRESVGSLTLTPTSCKRAILGDCDEKSPQGGVSSGRSRHALPAGHDVPEMLTVVDKPVIQYVVDEAREANVQTFIFVTGRNKAVIEDHFDLQFELYDALARSAARTRCLPAFSACNYQPGQIASRASKCRSASATRSGVRESWSVTSRSRCCSPT